MGINLETTITCDYVVEGAGQCVITVHGKNVKEAREEAAAKGWLILRLGAVSFCPSHREGAEESIQTP